MNLKRLTHLTFPYAILLVMIIAMVGTAYWTDPIEWMQRVLADQHRWLTLCVFGLLMSTATVFAPLTVAVAVPFMAKAFGPFTIFVTSWISWMVGAIVVFWISRRYGKPIVERFFLMDRLEKIQQKMPKHLDFWVLLLLRTFTPVDVLSYAVGLFSTINFKKYVLATALGIIPFAFVLSYGPDAITGDNPWLLFSFLLLTLTIITAIAIFYFSELLRPKVKIYTHDGKFHTDDVFAVAVIQLILTQQQRRYEVIRTRDEQVLDQARLRADVGEDVFITDVSGIYDHEHNQFDHHQIGGAGVRENGLQYASFGLVWNTYGLRLCDNNGEIVAMVDELFGQKIDGPDNGQELFSINPQWNVGPITIYEIIEDLYREHGPSNPRGQQADFENAVAWARNMIPRIITHATTQVENNKRAGQIYAQAEDKRLVISEDYVGRNYFVKFPETLLVVSPRTSDVNGDWSVVVVPQEANGVKGRIRFPQSWWGLRDSQLQEISGIKGAQFVHRSGDFLAVAGSKKSAIEMAQKTLE